MSDWSSDVCSSDLGLSELAALRRFEGNGSAAARRRADHRPVAVEVQQVHQEAAGLRSAFPVRRHPCHRPLPEEQDRAGADRKSVVKGKSVSVRVDLGGRRIIKKKQRVNKTERKEKSRR